MKKLLVVLAIGLASMGAYAQHGGHGGRGGFHGGYRGGYSSYWVAPLIIGGVWGYALTQPPIIVQQPPVIYLPNPNMSSPIGYHYEQINDAACGCYRTVLVPN